MTSVVCLDEIDILTGGYGSPQCDSFTDREWATGRNPERMWEFVRDRASDRKWRLYACACLRRVWDHLPHDSRRAVEAAELYADGLLTRGQKMPLHQRAAIAARATRDPDSAQAAALAAQYTLDIEMRPYKFATLTRTAVTDADPAAHADLMRDVFDNPFRPSAVRREWLTSSVVGIARGIYAERAFEFLPVLGDALQDAGCDDRDVLDHCREPGPHVRGCWVVDLVLGKA